MVSCISAARAALWIRGRDGIRSVPVIYSVEGKHLVVLVVRIGHRKEVYENVRVQASRVLLWRQRKKRRAA